MWDLIRVQFDKLLLAFFILYFSALGFHSVYVLEIHHIDNPNPIVTSFMNAMFDNQKLVIGAFLGVITGRALGKTNGGTNGTTTNSSTTSTSTTSTH